MDCWEGIWRRVIPFKPFVLCAVNAPKTCSPAEARVSGENAARSKKHHRYERQGPLVVRPPAQGDLYGPGLEPYPAHLGTSPSRHAPTPNALQTPRPKKTPFYSAKYVLMNFSHSSTPTFDDNSLISPFSKNVRVFYLLTREFLLLSLSLANQLVSKLETVTVISTTRVVCWSIVC